MLLIDALADSWGTEDGPAEGKWVWFTVTGDRCATTTPQAVGGAAAAGGTADGAGPGGSAGPRAVVPVPPAPPGRAGGRTSPTGGGGEVVPGLGMSYRAVVNGLPDAVTVCDSDGRVVAANPAAGRLFAVAPHRILGQVLTPGTDPAEAALRFAAVRAHLHQQDRWDGELVFLRGDGEPRIARCTVTALPAEDVEGPGGFLVVSRDVTDEVAAARSTLEAEQRWRLTLDYAPTGIALVDLHGRWLRVNAALCRIVGYTEAELLTRSFQDITHPDDIDTDLTQNAQLLTGQIEHYTLDKRYRHAAGHDVHVRVSKALAWGADGDPLHYITQVQDVTAPRLTAQRLTGIIAGASDAFTSIDAAGRITEWNTAAADMFGWTRPQALGRSAAELLLPARSRRDPAGGREGDGVNPNPLAVGGPTGRVELLAVRRDGTRLPVEITTWTAPDSPGERHAFLRDLSGRDRAAEQARRAAHQQAILEAQTDLAQVELTPSTVMRHICQRAAILTRATGAALELHDGHTTVCRAVSGLDAAHLGKQLPLAGSLTTHVVRTGQPVACHDSDHDPRVDRHACRRAGVRSLLLVPLRRDGATVGVLTVVSGQPAQFTPDDLTALDLLAGPFSTAVSNAHTLQATSRQALTDPVTALPNRTHALHDLARRLTRPGHRTAVAFIDLDGFKTVNDTHGHPAGDQLLTHVADRLRATVRSADLAARYGGDEFLVLAELTHPDDAPALADRLVHALAGGYPLTAGTATITASVGVAVAATPDITAAHLLHAADHAMYQAKQAGGNQHRTSHTT